VIAVSAGGAHSLALLSNGTVMADEVGEPAA
jgi:Regulator of chromosome condensation (RCC1) repeat